MCEVRCTTTTTTSDLYRSPCSTPMASSTNTISLDVLCCLFLLSIFFCYVLMTNTFICLL